MVKITQLYEKFQPFVRKFLKSPKTFTTVSHSLVSWMCLVKKPVSLQTETFFKTNSWNCLTTQFFYLSNNTSSLRVVIDRSDCHTNIYIANSSVMSIIYFKNIEIPSLNWRYYSISSLRSNVFYKYVISELNLSYSQIKTIKNHAFAFSEIDFLDLSHNEIEILKNISDDAHISEIDLLCNKIQSVCSHTFEKKLVSKDSILPNLG